MKTFKEVHVGFTTTYNPDTDSRDGLLGYIVRKPTDGWERWRDQKIEPKIISNEPRKGFRVVNSVKRSSEWFGSGRNMFRILHPEGFQFEITANNLTEILTTDVSNLGEFQGSYALCWSDRYMALIPEDSDIYREAVKTQKTKNFGKTTCEEGTYVTLQIGSSLKKALYLGWKTTLLTDYKEKLNERNKYVANVKVYWDKHRHWFDVNGTITNYRSVKYLEVLNEKGDPYREHLFHEQENYELILKSVENQPISWDPGEYYGGWDHYWNTEGGVDKVTRLKAVYSGRHQKTRQALFVEVKDRYYKLK